MLPLNIVNIHPLATREYRHAARWYGQRSELTEERFRTEIKRLIDRIEDNPLQGSIYSTIYRSLKASRFPYVVYYRQIALNRWMVMAIAHAHRRPGYWLKRQ